MSTEKHFFSPSAEETRRAGLEFGKTLSPGTLVCFRGDLGAGKTTFIQGVLTACGAALPFVSPTFVLMKEYCLVQSTESGIWRVYHADAYRMETAEDFEKIGFSEWCADRDGVVLLEWPGRVESLLPENRIEIQLNLEEGKEETRSISIRVL
ncbi:MAG: tRNA (adenosine(37)-N6)-threonylcarbamoyltransferase complex ATPase subunit type 1 TsaE [Candidatus Moranbacteria bacterium]|jgi:tRNA threonylcarbamoyladenosine biosynthesis protein TsaE|nr:tRNA (adenosine(37)-N6)-threonylcarbamoyltransferase complex ATPase subunit type 1 TsaE [Candidatus Moranbacteria bacterium]MBP9801323.1 tRNA (adenosine(37)-N6)-threonylcarbamoyltransferase complex ATPase subunit type 1 TsaE [Candidatus Moranbacteria bacterium]